MKINISKESLLDVLNVVSKGMSSRATLPILSGILISAEGGEAVFQTTDLEISIKHTVPAEVVEEGKIVVPGKLVSDIVKQLPDAAVQIAGDNEQVTITCMESNYNLSALNPADFPYFPEIDTTTTIVLPADELNEGVKKVVRAVSRDESRAILTGILFVADKNNVRLVATDSYRLAIFDMQAELSIQDGFQAIIPGKIFEDVARLCAADEEELSIGFTENQIVFMFGGTVFVSRKIEGTYPNYEQLIPKEKTSSIIIDSDVLATTVKRISLLVQAHNPVRFKFSQEQQKITVSTQAQDVGDAEESVDAEIEGEDIEIAFNHQFFLDGLASIDGSVCIDLQSSLKPGILRSADDGSFIYLAMPVRLS